MAMFVVMCVRGKYEQRWQCPVAVFDDSEEASARVMSMNATAKDIYENRYHESVNWEMDLQEEFYVVETPFNIVEHDFEEEYDRYAGI